MTRKCCVNLVFLVLLVLVVAACGSGSPLTPAPTSLPLDPSAEAPVEAAAPTQPPGDTPLPTEQPSPTPVATPAGPRAAVIDVVNDVEAHPLPGDDWIPAQPEMAIYLEGEVWAKEASTARLALQEPAVPSDFGTSTVRVAPNTIFTYGQPDADTLEFQLDEGQMWIDIEGLEPGKTFEIETPDGVASVRGTRFSVRVVPGRGTVVSVQEGAVTLGSAGATTVITPGSEGLLRTGNGAPGLAVPVSIEEQLRWGMATGAGLDIVFPASGSVVTFTHPGGISEPQLSPDGGYLAFYYYYRKNDESFRGSVLYDVENGEVVRDSPLQAGDDGVHFSPQGDRLAFVRHGESGDQICVSTLDELDAAACFGGAVTYGWPFWTADGEWLVFYARLDSPTDPWHLYRVRPDGTDLAPLTPGGDVDEFNPAPSPSGAWFAYSTAPVGDYEAPGTVWLAQADGSEPRQVFEGANAHHGLTWSPDSSKLAIRGQTGGLYLYDLAANDISQLPGTESYQCAGATWSPTPDGWPLFFSAYDPETFENLGVYTTQGQAPPEPFSAASWGPIWSGDGMLAAFGALGAIEDIPVTTFYMVASEPAFYP